MCSGRLLINFNELAHRDHEGSDFYKQMAEDISDDEVIRLL